MMAESTTQTLTEAALAQLIVETLKLDQKPGEIDPEAQLYGEGVEGDGLGLDSIDMLEIALVVSQRYGVKLRAGEDSNVEIFRSLRSLNAYIQTHREP